MLNSHQTPTMVKMIEGIDVTIDINFSLFWAGYSGEDISVSKFISDRKKIQLWEANGIIVPVLSTEKFLIQLFIHAYKEANGFIYITYNNGLNIRAFLDIYYYIKNNLYGINYEKFIMLIDEWNLGKIVYFISFYIAELFGEQDYTKLLKERYRKYRRYVDYFGLDKERKVLWGDLLPIQRFFIQNPEIINNKLNEGEKNILNHIREVLY